MFSRSTARAWIALAISVAIHPAFEREARAATLIYSNDVLGELEPCGCRSNPLGGLPRKGSLLDLQKDRELLQLDAGDLLFETNIIPDALAPQRRLQAERLAQAHVRLGHDAVVPGEKDFALGLAVFERIRKASGLRFLAANLRDRDGKSFLRANRVFYRRRRDGRNLKIGVFGLVGDAIPFPDGLKVRPSQAAAREQVKSLRAQHCDRIIALTHQGYDADLELARSVPGIDVIVGGHTQTFLQTPTQEGSTTILQSSFRNQYVGVADLDKPITNETHKLVALDESLEPQNHPSSRRSKQMAEAVVSLKKAISELNTREPKLTQSDSRSEKKTKSSFQTFPHCSGCHLKQFDFWRKTPHIHALEVLIQSKQEQNKDCLVCHSLGLGLPHGYSEVTQLAETNQSRLSAEDLASLIRSIQKASSLTETIRLTQKDAPTPIPQAIARLKRAWAPVQCENCHSTTGDHPFEGSISKAVPTSTCLKCHSAERAPTWYGKDGQPNSAVIATKRPLVSCPAGDTSPAFD